MSAPTTEQLADGSDLTGFTNSTFGNGDIAVADGLFTGPLDGFGAMQWNGGPYGLAQEVWATIPTLGNPGEQFALHVCDSSTGSGYNSYQINMGQSGLYSLYRIDAGAPTTLVAGTQTYAAGDTFVVRRVNDMVYAYLLSSSGVTLFASAQDDTYMSGGSISLEIYNNVFRIGPFGGGDISGFVDPSYATFPQKLLRNQTRLVG